MKKLIARIKQYIHAQIRKAAVKSVTKYPMFNMTEGECWYLCNQYKPYTADQWPSAMLCAHLAPTIIGCRIKQKLYRALKGYAYIHHYSKELELKCYEEHVSIRVKCINDLMRYNNSALRLVHKPDVRQILITRVEQNALATN
jgi:hypothetical protein